MDTSQFAGRDGGQLAYRDAGSGRPLILLHGFLGTGSFWLEGGPAAALGEHGFRLVLPDLRGHGESTPSHDPRLYPPDVLADDGLALIDHLGLGPGEYDLGGYSLGARIVVRMLARGAEPGRAVVAGQGLAKVSGPQGGGVTERALTALVDGTALDPGSPEAKLAHWVGQFGADPRALLLMLRSLVPTPVGALRRIATPTLVVIGDQDERSDADELAALLPAGRYARVPGGHGDAFAAPEFGAAVTAFLAGLVVSFGRDGIARTRARDDTECMDRSASLTPRQRIAAECASRGGGAVIAGCVALLGGRADEVDDGLITVLGGEAARHVLDGGEGGRSGHWPRVWAARGLLHAWDDRVVEADAMADTVTAALIGAMGDDDWRVREMAAKVVARHRVGGALDAAAALRDDPVARVRHAATRAVVALTAALA
jgi:pimeloyl-ACP methyl ester carboxylesterase